MEASGLRVVSVHGGPEGLQHVAGGDSEVFGGEANRFVTQMRLRGQRGLIKGHHMKTRVESKENGSGGGVGCSGGGVPNALAPGHLCSYRSDRSGGGGHAGGLRAAIKRRPRNRRHPAGGAAIPSSALASGGESRARAQQRERECGDARVSLGFCGWWMETRVDPVALRFPGEDFAIHPPPQLH